MKKTFLTILYIAAALSAISCAKTEVLGPNDAYKRYFEAPGEFATSFPFPSVSISDPSFVKELPPNCWGGNAQALTALRASMWLPRYGRADERERLLKRWMRAFIDHNNPMTQELDPFTGAPIGIGVNYMPSLFIFKQAADLILK